MFEVLEFKENVTMKRIGVVTIKYYDLVMECDVCLFNRQKLWVRMAEKWVSKTQKVKYSWWPTADLSQEFQDKVLKKVFDMVGLDLDEAVKILDSRKHLTKQKNKLTLE